jgi:sterol desaturase/sphingolipid hydroxylase (fatty acid hydroxylase superfamily)
MTQPAQRQVAWAPIGLSFVLRVAALVFFIFAIIAGYNWGLASWHWEGLTASGLGLWCGSTLVA